MGSLAEKPGSRLLKAACRRSIGRLAGQSLALLLLACTPAWAEDQLLVLHQDAIQVRDPAHVLLISIAHAGKRLVAVGEHGMIIYSDDNGGSWKQAAVPVEVTITTVAFATPQIGWAAGAYGVVLHTEDGGTTWQDQLTGIEVNKLMSRAAAEYAQAHPDTPAAALALRRANIFVSAGPDKPFLTILARTAESATVFGGYRMCVHTDDGGKTWADCSLQVLDPVSHNLYQALNAADTTYLVGEAGDVFSYNALNGEYQPLTSPGSSTLFDILTTKAGTLLAFGVADGMFRSIDQGKIWAPVTVPGGSDLTGGTILDDGTIVVASENGAIYTSTDDGESFHAAPEGVGMGLFGVTTAANGDLVFVGSGGIRVVPQTAVTRG
jgi:photosystem II stability/assembly factor-like uncharacterized protein